MRIGSSVRLGLLALLWGSNFLLIRVALEGLSPLGIVLARMLLGAGVLLAVLRIRGQRLPAGWGVWRRLTVAALVGNIVPYLLFAWAEQTVPSHVAGALNATTPLFTLGIAILMGQQERVTASRVVGLALGFAGALTVLAPWRQAGLGGSLAGQVACLVAAASYGLSYVYIRRHLTGRGLGPLVLAASQLAAAAVLLLPLTPFFVGALRLSPAVLGSVTALGVLGTGAAYILNYRLIQDEGATTASTVTYLLPVVAVVGGVAVLGEPVTWSLLAGTVLVLLGVGIAEGRLGRPQRRQRPAARSATRRSRVG